MTVKNGSTFACPDLSTSEDLVVARSDIEFCDATSECVRIQIKVRNSSDRPSPPRLMSISSAPLGAFLPWRPLVSLTIPSLRPGAKTLVETAATRIRPLPLGRIERIPPGRLVAAFAQHDDADGRSGFKKRVASSIFDLLDPCRAHWVGNINVFVNYRGTERHLAGGLRVQPGRLNSAIFIVGDSRLSDEYSFRVLGDGIAWESRLFAMPLFARSLFSTCEGIAIEEARWIPASRVRFVNLQFRPPANSRLGKIDVEVTQRSTGRRAVVEFSLDAAAEGPGCFVV